MTIHKTAAYFISFGTFILLLCVPLLSAEAYFSGEALAEDGTFSAGELGFTSDETDLAASITADTGDTVSFTVSDDGTIEQQFAITAAISTCSASFYNGLAITASLDSTVVYQGALSTMNATSTDAGAWEFLISASSTLVAADNETCEVDIEMNAWQDIFPLQNTGGFSDAATITLTITADEAIGAQSTDFLVLNEVYANPNPASSSPLDIEWIELYNGTDNPIDVLNWVVSERTDTNLESIHTIVPDCTGYSPSDHMEPLDTNDTVIQPGGLLVVKFCGSDSYLNNDGDIITLYENGITIRDSYTYADAVLGKSDARIPDGATWVDPIPTPGTPNTATREELEAEGWDDTMITEVLGESTAPVLINDAPEDTGGNSGGSEVVKPVDDATVPDETDDLVEEEHENDPNADTDETDPEFVFSSELEEEIVPDTSIDEEEEEEDVVEEEKAEDPVEKDEEPEVETIEKSDEEEVTPKTETENTTL